MTAPPERDSSPAPYRRGDARDATERDLARRKRRAAPGHFWQAVGLIGSVGWPIVLLSGGGALLGRWADARLDTGVRLTFTLVALGAAVGTFIAFRSVKGPP